MCSCTLPHQLVYTSERPLLTQHVSNYTTVTATLHQACIEELEAHSAAVTNSKAQQMVDAFFNSTDTVSATTTNGSISTSSSSTTAQQGSPEARVNAQTGRLELL
jgi:hypothetical protein